MRDIVSFELFACPQEWVEQGGKICGGIKEPRKGKSWFWKGTEYLGLGNQDRFGERGVEFKVAQWIQAKTKQNSNVLQLQEKLAMKLGKYWFKNEAETNKIKGPFMQVGNKITSLCAFL